MSAYRQHVTLSEIDHGAGLSKGTAFRAFKSLVETLQEGVDYEVLHHQQAHKSIAELRAAGRLYGSSINVIVLTANVAERVSAAAQALAASGR